MIVVDIHRLTQWLSVMVLVLAAPLVYAVGGEGAFWPGLWGPWVVPLVLAGEVAVFVHMLRSQRQVRSLTPAAVVAVALVTLRAVCSFGGAVMVWHFGGGAVDLGIQVANFWMGAPLAVVLQLLVISLALPVALHVWAPGFLNERALEQLTRMAKRGEERRRSARGAESRAPAQVISPSPEEPPAPAPTLQPFIYDFEDLERYFMKVIGLEGFLILSDEGLVIWTRMPWRDRPENLAGRVASWLAACSSISTPRPISRPDVALVQAQDRWAVGVGLSHGATLCLFFTERLSTTQVAQTTPRLAEAARSLFAYRYGGEQRGAAPEASPKFEEEETLPWSLSLKS